MPGAPGFSDRILILHTALDGAEIGHGFGGAIALAYHVEDPRATADIDINIHAGVDEARAVLAILPEGIEVTPDAAERIRTDGQIRVWWGGRSGTPVDLFFPQHEFHAEVARDTFVVPFLDQMLPIISATHLTVFKAMFNRSRDWPDIEAMLGAGGVDVDRALDWIDRLLGPGSEQEERLRALVP